MKKKVFVIAVLTILLKVTTFSQGWQSLGLDSVNWSNVRNMSIRWTDPYSYDIAASTLSGVAFRPVGSPWIYSLPNSTAKFYISVAFSPWNDCLLYTSPSPRDS